MTVNDMTTRTLDIAQRGTGRIGDSIPAIAVTVLLVLLQLYVFRWQAFVAIVVGAAAVGMLTYAVLYRRRTITIGPEHGLITVWESGFAGTRMGERVSRCALTDVQGVVLEDQWRGGRDVVRVVLQTRDGRRLRLTGADVGRLSGQRIAEGVRSFLETETPVEVE